MRVPESLHLRQSYERGLSNPGYEDRNLHNLHGLLTLTKLLYQTQSSYRIGRECKRNMYDQHIANIVQ